MAIDKDLLTFYRVGVQKVANCGQYGSTFYIFEAGGKIHSTNNRAQVVGEVIEVVHAERKGVQSEHEHGRGNEITPHEYATPQGDGRTLA